MNYALFVAESPTDDAPPEKRRDWQNFAGIARDKMATLGGVTRLHQGVYLCTLPAHLLQLATLVCLAAEWRVPSRTAFCDQEPTLVMPPELNS